MRVNKFLAQNSGLSRRKADEAIKQGRVTIDTKTAILGDQVVPESNVCLDDKPLQPYAYFQTIILNKPVSYVCSRKGQGSQTIYDLLPKELRHLNPVGRLDKDSSGLLLLTNDGALAQKLSHPSNQKTKVYEVALDKPLAAKNKQQIQNGIELEDGPSKLQVKQLPGNKYEVKMHEGRNRQIRRTFASLGYKVNKLHRTKFGSYSISSTRVGGFREA